MKLKFKINSKKEETQPVTLPVAGEDNSIVEESSDEEIDNRNTNFTNSSLYVEVGSPNKSNLDLSSDDMKVGCKRSSHDEESEEAKDFKIPKVEIDEN